MTTKKERNAVFHALVSNGLDFIERSAQELADHQKFSVAHFATGLELVLKARLFAEHWTLIATTPHSCAWSAVRDGTVRTIQASDICSAITSVTGTSLRHESEVFAKIFRHRNKVLHWVPDDTVQSVAAEQCLAWYRLHALLRGRWKEYFLAFSPRVEEVDASLLNHRAYLQVRYGELERTLRGHAARGCLVECPACGFQSAVLQNAENRVIAIDCDVCFNQDALTRFSCGHLVQLDALPVDCECGESHDRGELLDELAPQPLLSPKESLGYEPDRLFCGECLESEKTVAPDGDGYVCVSCGTRYDQSELNSCDWCSESWAGYRTENSYYLGCEFCDGYDPT